MRLVFYRHTQGGSAAIGGLVWSWPYGTSWIATTVPRSPSVIRDHLFRFKTFMNNCTDCIEPPRPVREGRSLADGPTFDKVLERWGNRDNLGDNLEEIGVP